MVKGAFIDRDGVINHNDRSKPSGPYYTLHKDQVEFIDGAADSMRMLGNAGFKIYWITCQNSIVEGKATYTQIDDICDFMIYKVHESTGIMVDYAICTTPTEDSELKVIAKRDAVLRFAMKDNINLRKSFGAGDARSDIQAFRRAGVGHLAHIDIPRGDHCVAEADVTFPNLKEAVVDFLHTSSVPAFMLASMLATKIHCVKKVWGNEYWLVNSKAGNYCSKILELKEGHRASRHYHNKKHETFLVLSGVVHINHSGVLRKCTAGDQVEIKQGEEHWFESLYGDSFILEVSTYHEDEDCVRLEKSI
jgi:histidinol phosphatase-like enzyme/mannose-6-phosphate isomerase-like protein (cupin superfamily)